MMLPARRYLTLLPGSLRSIEIVTRAGAASVNLNVPRAPGRSTSRRT